MLASRSASPQSHLIRSCRNGHSHLLFEEVLTFDERTEKTLLLLVLQLRIGLFEVLDQVVQRLQHLLNELGHLYGLALHYAVQGPAGEERRRSKHLIPHENKLTQFVCSLAFNRVGISDLSLLDEVGEEECGVADDASSARLLMLTALQDEPIIHVTLRMEAGLVQDREHIHMN